VRLLDGRRLGLVGLLVVFLLALPAVVLASGSSPARRPGALRTVSLGPVARGRVLSRQGRLFAPVAAALAARGVGAGVGVGREIRALRTTSSDTFAAGRGQLFTKVFPFAVNYRQAGGRLVPIDNTLVTNPDGSYRNRANGFGVRLPAALGAAPVRFSSGGAWLSFSLQGARGRGQVAANSERFAGALPGVAVRYTVGNIGLAEALTLHGKRVPASFS